MKRIGIIALLVAIGVGLVACGDDTTDESGELSPSEFASQASDACQANTKKVDDALKNVNPGVPSGPQSAEAIRQVATFDKQLISRVDDLAAPESEQDTITELLDKWRDRASQEEQIATAIDEGEDATQLEALNDTLNSIEDDANKIAESLDLDDSCQRGGT
jgi:hypothetical protein